MALLGPWPSALPVRREDPTDSCVAPGSKDAIYTLWKIVKDRVTHGSRVRVDDLAPEQQQQSLRVRGGVADGLLGAWDPECFL